MAFPNYEYISLEGPYFTTPPTEEAMNSHINQASQGVAQSDREQFIAKTYKSTYNTQIYVTYSNINIMNRACAIKQFDAYDIKGRYVFTLNDLTKLFPEDTQRSLQAGLSRLIESGLLMRIAKGIYLNPLSRHKGVNTIEQIAKTIRRGEYNYISLESALSEYGVISQIPMDRLTVVTTGRKGEYKTPFGTIEFTHTKRTLSNIIGSIKNTGRPLRIATKNTAYRDLNRVGRNTHLVEQGMINESF